MKYSIALVCGLGNVIISLAGFYHILKETGIDPRTHVEVFDWVDKPYENGYILGGHPRQKEINIGQIFPRIGFSNSKKSLKDKEVNFTTFFCNDYYYGYNFRELINHTTDKLTEWMVVMGWFFHPGYRSSYRDEIIQWLELGDEVKSQVYAFFRENNVNPTTTVSLHCRLGSPGDNSSVVNTTNTDYLKGLLYLKSLYPFLDTVLVCSESREIFEKYLTTEQIEKAGYSYVFYDSDVENCLYAMKECAHHLLTNSTLSYSVMYLDEKFPHKSLVIGTHIEYLRPDFIDDSFISKDGITGLLHFKNIPG